jgi:hypothetical protein
MMNLGGKEYDEEFDEEAWLNNIYFPFKHYTEFFKNRLHHLFA